VRLPPGAHCGDRARVATGDDDDLIAIEPADVSRETPDWMFAFLWAHPERALDFELTPLRRVSRGSRLR
jgi:hypothetical protein